MKDKHFHHVQRLCCECVCACAKLGPKLLRSIPVRKSTQTDAFSTCTGKPVSVCWMSEAWRLEQGGANQSCWKAGCAHLSLVTFFCSLTAHTSSGKVFQPRDWNKKILQMFFITQVYVQILLQCNGNPVCPSAYLLSAFSPQLLACSAGEWAGSTCAS